VNSEDQKFVADVCELQEIISCTLDRINKLEIDAWVRRSMENTPATTKHRAYTKLVEARVLAALLERSMSEAVAKAKDRDDHDHAFSMQAARELWRKTADRT
jgi:hypothetical protein